MKRSCFFRIVLFSTALLLLLSVPVSASQTVPVQLELIQEGALPTPDSHSSVVCLMSDVPSLDDYLYEQLSAAAETIDVSAYGLQFDPVTNGAPALTEALQRVVNSNPALFYVTGSCEFIVTDGIVTAVTPHYTVTGPALMEEIQIYSTKLSDILAMVDEDWTDLEKILFFNDYLASHYEYDLSYSIYSMEGFLKYGTGVCQAYYLTCRALLDACGIRSYYGQSDAANHIWNVVELDGNWYHLDITWNDPILDTLGAAQHDYFLISTETLLIQDPDRTDWVSDGRVSCTDTTYDQFYWKGIETPFVQIDGVWYYGDSNAICRSTNLYAPGTPLITHGIWPVIGSPYSHWIGAFSGLGVYHDCLIYNTADQIIAYDPLTGESVTVCGTATEDLDIYGLVVSGDTVVYELNDRPRGSAALDQSVSLAFLDDIIPEHHVQTCRGVTVYETDGFVTIAGVASPAKPFWIITAGYTKDGKMKDLQMIHSSQLASGAAQWQLNGQIFDFFFLEPTYSPVSK